MSAAQPARRAFLAGLAAVAAPAVVAPVAAATVAPSIQEVPEILDIGQRLPALVEAARAAEARKAEAKATYETTRPPVPDQLVVKPGEHPWRDTTDDELDVDGRKATFNGGFPGRTIYRARNIKAFLIRWDAELVFSDDVKRLKKIARIARKHERAEAEALAQSGYKARKRDLEHANEAIDEQADRLLKLQPVTFAGLLVYARAMSACQAGLADQLGEVIADALLKMDAEANAAAV